MTLDHYFIDACRKTGSCEDSDYKFEKIVVCAMYTCHTSGR